MTDIITTHPIPTRHFSLPHVTLPKFRFGAALGSLIALIAEAKVQAHLAPFSGIVDRARTNSEPFEDGRDSNR